MQMDLFGADHSAETAQQAKVSREQLREWVRDAWTSRHSKDTTNWSTASFGYMFAANYLYRKGLMDGKELARWQRFAARLDRMDMAHNAHNT